MSEAWRSDPNWVLVEWVTSFWTTPPAKPTPEAELTGGGNWCAHFKDHRPMATWYRTGLYIDKQSVRRKG